MPPHEKAAVLSMWEKSEQFVYQRIHTEQASTAVSPAETVQCGRAVGTEWPLSERHLILSGVMVAFAPTVGNSCSQQLCIPVSWSQVRDQGHSPPWTEEFVQVDLGGGSFFHVS